MGVSENPVWLDSRLTSGKAFDGTWSTALASVRDVKEPATGQVLSQVGIASAADMRAAIDRAHAAQPAWAAMGPRERSAVFHRAAALFQQHFAELAMTISRETGGILPKGQHEVNESITLCHLAAGLPMQAQGQVLPAAAGRLSFARRVPHGVVGVISPFNFPLILGLRSVAPALALGNAVVLKPDTRTPVSGGFIIARVFEEAGLPKGVLQVLPGDAEAGEALVTDPRVPMIAFTGSPTVGRRIGALAGEHLKKVSLELGGANNLIILEDADLDAAASAAAFGAWFHQGQICMASNRILVHESIAEGILQRMVGKATHLPVGDGASGQVALGPMIDAKQLAQRLATGEEFVLLDVREAEELALAALPGVIHLPLSRSQEWLETLPERLSQEKNLVVICHGGIRSWHFGCWLIDTHGYTKVWNLEGGIDAWSVQVDPSLPRY